MPSSHWGSFALKIGSNCETRPNQCNRNFGKTAAPYFTVNLLCTMTPRRRWEPRQMPLLSRLPIGLCRLHCAMRNDDNNELPHNLQAFLYNWWSNYIARLPQYRTLSVLQNYQERPPWYVTFFHEWKIDVWNGGWRTKSFDNKYGVNWIINVYVQ